MTDRIEAFEADVKEVLHSPHLTVEDRLFRVDKMMSESDVALKSIVEDGVHYAFAAKNDDMVDPNMDYIPESGTLGPSRRKKLKRALDQLRAQREEAAPKAAG